jgi:ADP-L-glycero-D-manno-heptose 6-epimerase
MIVVTGAAGFISSCLVSELNKQNENRIIVVDDFSKHEKDNNLQSKIFNEKVERDDFFDWFENNKLNVTFVFHLGARTDTTEQSVAIFDELNLNYSKKMWQVCSQYNIPLIYASSAATYGNGEFGYDDNHDVVNQLVPLNPYGESKNDFDKWVLQQKSTPPFWAGLKFFNVYGPNEYHKGRMASVIFHSFHQLINTRKIKLFKSHNPNYTDGGQMRDFIYVKDLINICLFLQQNQTKSGIYNVGTGKAETFLELALSTFDALGIEPNIDFIDTPIDIRDKYQYFTEANMQKLLNIGYPNKFFSLREGVNEYVKNYLMPNKYF